MTTKRFSSLRVATETTFASIDSSNGVPSAVGLVWHTAELMDMTQIVTFGDPKVSPNESARTGFYDLPPRPDTVEDGGGSPIERRGGTITFDIPVAPIGDRTTFADYEEHPLGQLQSTILQRSSPGVSTITPISAGGSASTFTAAPLVMTAGQVLGVQRNDTGRPEYAAKHAGAATVADIRPDLSTIAAVADTVAPMEQWGLPHAGAPTTTTVALQLTGDGWSATAYGCQAQSIRYATEPETRRLVATVEMLSPFIAISITSGTPSDVVYADGRHLHQLASLVNVSTTGITVGETGIGNVADNAICLDTFELVITSTLEPVGCGTDVVGQSGWEQTNVETRCTLMLSYVDDAWSEMLWLQTMPNVMVGFNGASLTNPGEGGCIYIPAAVLLNDPKILDTGAERNRVKLELGAGPYVDDDGSTSPADDHLRVCLGAGTP